MQRPVVSVIIPNFNGTQLLKKNLPAVIKALQSDDELLIVDDASTDNSVAYLQKEFQLTEKKIPVNPQVSSDYFPQLSTTELHTYQGTHQVDQKSITITVITLTKNHRFAGAVNVGAAYARHHLFFVCNSDVVPAQNLFSVITQHFADESVFAVGCKEFAGADRHHPSGKNRLWFERGLFMHSKAIDFSSGDTAWASGGSAMIASEKWFALDGFDKRFYPAYWEDIDLSFRARISGWKVLFDSNAVVYHTHESTNEPVFGSSAITQMSWKNAFTFTWKHASLLQRLQFVLWLPYWLWKQYV